MGLLIYTFKKSVAKGIRTKVRKNNLFTTFHNLLEKVQAKQTGPKGIRTKVRKNINLLLLKGEIKKYISL